MTKYKTAFFITTLESIWSPHYGWCVKPKSTDEDAILELFGNNDGFTTAEKAAQYIEKKAAGGHLLFDRAVVSQYETEWPDHDGYPPETCVGITVRHSPAKAYPPKTVKMFEPDITHGNRRVVCDDYGVGNIYPVLYPTGNRYIIKIDDDCVAINPRLYDIHHGDDEYHTADDALLVIERALNPDSPLYFARITRDGETGAAFWLYGIKQGEVYTAMHQTTIRWFIRWADCHQGNELIAAFHALKNRSFDDIEDAQNAIAKEWTKEVCDDDGIVIEKLSTGEYAGDDFNPIKNDIQKAAIIHLDGKPIGVINRHFTDAAITAKVTHYTICDNAGNGLYGASSSRRYNTMLDAHNGAVRLVSQRRR